MIVAAVAAAAAAAAAAAITACHACTEAGAVTCYTSCDRRADDVYLLALSQLDGVHVDIISHRKNKQYSCATAHVNTVVSAHICDVLAQRVLSTAVLLPSFVVVLSKLYM
jgi:hypothetical protein